MKKTSLRVFLTAIVFTLFVWAIHFPAALADDIQWTQWNWKTYGIKFQLPSTLEVKVNTTDEFTAEASDAQFVLYPWKEKSLSLEDVAKEAYKNMAVDKGTPKVIGEEKFDAHGLNGYRIVGTGKQEGKEIVFIVLGLIDPNSDVNLAGYVTFYPGSEDESYLDAALSVAAKLVESIGKM